VSRSNVATVVNTAGSLIVQITDMLMGFGDSYGGHQNLALEFESLQKIFAIIVLIIRKYDNNALGQTLAETITLEIL
jgi:hypothetical protein